MPYILLENQFKQFVLTIVEFYPKTFMEQN